MSNSKKEKTMTVKKATLINGAAKYYAVLCSFVVNVILSRVLTPAEYGVVAVVTIFTTFFTIFSDMGVGTAFIQNKTLTNEDKNYLFTFMVYVGIVLFFCFFGFSYFIAWFYGNDVYITVSWILGINLFTTAVNVIPYSDLLKQQRFKLVGIVQAIAVTFAAGVAIVLAYNGFSYYSIAIQSVVSVGLYTIVFICISRPKFVFKTSMSSIKKIAGFSVGQLGFSFINYFSRNIDNLLVGKILGDEQLGYYDKSYKTTTFVVSNFASIIGSSIQPVLSKYQDNVRFVYDEFKKAFLFLLSVGVFASVFLYFSASETILILYGDQWVDSIAPFAFLALSLFIQLTLNITGAFYQTLNKTKMMAINGLASAVILISGISIGLVLGGIKYVALCYFLAQCINFIKEMFVLHKLLFKVSAKQLCIHIVKQLIAGALTALLLYFTIKYIPSNNNVVSFIIKFAISFPTYVLLFFAMNEQNSVFDVLIPRLSRSLSTIYLKFSNRIDRFFYWHFHLKKRYFMSHLRNATKGNPGKESKKYDLVCSLTTIPSRIKYVVNPIFSMYNQIIRPRIVVLYIDENAFDNISLPEELNELIEKGFLIVRHVRDIGVHTKYYYAFNDYKDSLIMTIDDDVIYDKHLVEELLLKYEEYPDCVVATRAHKISFNDDKQFNSYNEWEWNYLSSTPHSLLVPTGVGGVLYNPKMFKVGPCQLELFEKLSPKNDDLWLKAIETINGIKTVTLDKLEWHWYSLIEESQNIALNKSNVHENKNDLQWKALCEHFKIDYDTIFN